MRVIIMRGTSCSGKDTYLENRDSLYPKSCILSSDNFRELLFGDRTYQRGNSQVFSTIHNILESRLLHRVATTVINATHIRMSDCKEIIRLCDKYGAAIEVVSIIPPDIEELRKRNEKRFATTGFHIPDHVFVSHLHRYEACIGEFLKLAESNPHYRFHEVAQDEI